MLSGEPFENIRVIHLDPNVCERARLSRDARFDGRFFTGVVTTGVYCRPVCPVRPPKAENVRFFPTAAAAAEAGFRPCLRCRPECSPGTPAWLGTSATVTRGLRLIAAGELDAGGVEVLAARLGIGPRHLSRLFVKHLGASPLAVAQTRRLHFAKSLIDDTELPMAQVGLSAGFNSVRRFNAAFRGAYGRTPSDLRRAARRTGGRAHPRANGGAFTLRLRYRPPFDWGSLLGFLALRATPGVEAVDAESYRRTIAIDGRQGVVCVRPGAGAHVLDVEITFPDPQALFRIVERVRRIFDLGADPEDISAHLRTDADLAPLVRAYPGIRVPGAWDGFELAVRAILGQQVTVKGATTLAGRVARTFGEPLVGSGADELHMIFPTPQALANANLTRIGLPKARADAVRGLARAVAAGEVSFDTSVGLEACVRQLTQLPGIGEWTAQYVAMRALSLPDAFPATDLGLLRAAATGKRKLTAAQLVARAEAWRPWRAYAAMYLWKRYADGMGSAPARSRNGHTPGRRRKPKQTGARRPRAARTGSGGRTG